MRFTTVVSEGVTAGDVFQAALVREPHLWLFITNATRSLSKMDLWDGTYAITLTMEEAQDFLSILRMKGVVCPPEPKPISYPTYFSHTR